MAPRFNWVWAGLAALAVHSSLATLYDGSSALTMPAHTTNIWAAQYPLPATCYDSSWVVSITMEVTATTPQADLVFAIGTDANYFAFVIAYDGSLFVDFDTKDKGAAFVAPADGQAMYSSAAGLANLYSVDWRSTLVPSGLESEWEMLAGRSTPIGDDTSPVVIDVVSDVAVGTTSVTVTKNGASVSSTFPSVFAARAVPSIFVDVDSYHVEEFLLSSISATRVTCPTTSEPTAAPSADPTMAPTESPTTAAPSGAPTSIPVYDGSSAVTLVSSDDWELQYPLCTTCADSSYETEITIDTTAVSEEADLVFAIGTSSKYFTFVVAYDGSLYVDFVEKEKGATWIAPASGQAMYTAEVATMYSKQWRTSLIPSGSDAEWDRVARKDSLMGSNLTPLKISVVSSATRGDTILSVTKGGRSVGSTFVSVFGAEEEPSLFMAVDSLHPEEFLVSSISSTCGACGGVADVLAPEGFSEPEGFGEPQFDAPDWMGDAEQFGGVAQAGGAAEVYSANFVNVMNVVAFLMGANLMCLVINCMSKRCQRNRAYKLVPVVESESELVQLA